MSGWSPRELGRLAPVDVVLYALAALERQGQTLAESIELFLLPIEAFGGDEAPIRDALQARAVRYFGGDPSKLKSTRKPKKDPQELQYRSLMEEAIEADDMERLAALEAEWDAILRARKAAGEQARTPSEWKGNVSLLQKSNVVKVNRG